mgnify:CR=1 FL=1
MATHFVAEHSLHAKHIDPALQQVFIEMVFGMEDSEPKVLIADEATMVADVRSMLRTTQFLKAARLDNGVDFPTVFRAYLDVIRGEFDFRAEAERMDEFRALFERRGLSDRVSVPEWFPEAKVRPDIVASVCSRAARPRSGRCASDAKKP